MELGHDFAGTDSINRVAYSPDELSTKDAHDAVQPGGHPWRAMSCWPSWAAAAWASSTVRFCTSLAQSEPPADKPNPQVAPANPPQVPPPLVDAYGDALPPEALARLGTTRFRQGGQVNAKHPNIVQVHEVGEHEGKPFFSLEYCAGGSLAQKLNATPLRAERRRHCWRRWRGRCRRPTTSTSFTAI